MSGKSWKRRIVLVRHGQTDWNLRYCFQGQTDVPLNAEGLAQAERLAERFAQWPAEVVYSSPLQRALSTAQALAKPRRLCTVVLEGLKEINFGAWEGRSILGMEREERGAFRTWMYDPFFNMPPGAETWEAIRDRVERALELILMDPHERIAVVTHGGIIRALFAVLLGLDPHTVWRLKVFNCSLSGVEIGSDGPALVFSNDDLHLRWPSGNGSGDTGGRPLPLLW